MSQQSNSSDPNKSNPEGDDMLSEYTKMTGKEAENGTNISNQDNQQKSASKAGDLDKANKAIHKNIEGADYDYIISKTGALMAGDSNTKLNLLKDNLSALGAEKKENIQKIAEKVKNRSVSGNKKILIGFLAVGILIAVIAIGRGVIVPNPGPPDKPISDNNPFELVVATQASPTCSIRFTKPVNTAEIPNFGPVLFEWTNVPAADGYSLKVSPPADTSLPWTYAVAGTSKKVYMENFPMGGNFIVSVNARGKDEKVLCTASLIFNKEELAAGDVNNSKNANNEDAEPVSTPCVETGIGYFCP